MKGRIAAINTQRGMVAVATETEDYSVFEILSHGPFEIDDEVSWEGRPLAHHPIQNHTKGETVDVYFQNHWVHKDQLRQQLLY
jgi:hypothetical protein